MTKKYKILIGTCAFFIILVIIITTHKKHIYIPAVKGIVYDNITKQKLDNIEIIGPGIFLPISPIKTDDKGFFFIDAQKYSYHPYSFKNEQYFFWKSISHNISFEKKNYKTKIVDLTKFKYSKKDIDTIDIGIIYMEKN